MKKQTKKHIVVVEDEKALREILLDVFDEEGYQITGAITAEEGLNLIIKTEPDLILLDIILPRMDGLAMLRKLRQKGSYGETVPVIILSNLNDQARIAEAMKLGVYDYVVKMNMQLKDLVHEVKEVFESLN